MRIVHIIFAVLLSLAGCAGEREKPIRLPGDDKVLAEVNKTDITQYDVERVAQDMFGTRAKAFDDATKRKLLESLVNSRAIAHAREKEMSAVELAELDEKVKAFREELLVQQYLAEHAHTEGVNPELARLYYEQNTELFGGGTARNYEVVSAPAAVADARQRAAMLEAFGGAAEQKDWSAWAEKLNREGKPVTVRRGQDGDGVLNPKLRQLIAQVKTGETSRPTLIDGAPYVARVTSESVRPPRPFSEVESEVAKALAPEQIKAAVKQVSTEVLKNAEVAYR